MLWQSEPECLHEEYVRIVQPVTEQQDEEKSDTESFLCL